MIQSTLIRPLITEKTMRLKEQGWFTFIVDRPATKPWIAHEIEKEFKVHVVKIMTSIVKGKTKRSGKKRLVTKSANWKKAIVKLKTNEKIDLFPAEGLPK